MSHLVISGVTGGASPNRLEINDFVKNDQQFSLYIQALQYMYNHSTQDDVQAFFQIGGIHGLPYVPWDGSNSVQGFDPNQQWGGYCTHGQVLFPTWHRPYVLLYEQILNERAQQIAATYTVNQASWIQAAANLRQPYWDWASNAVPPAEVISLQKVTITTPDGKRTSVPNPLYHYTFHPIDKSFPAPFSGWTTTHRQPKSISSSTTDNVTRLQQILKNVQSDLTTRIYNLLTRVNSWPAFSNHTVGDGGSTSSSLEGIHDSIHVYVGGNGHMSDPAVAGFDPIFFLHHANVDRMLSLWSAINPGVWVTAGEAEDGTFTLQPDQPVDETTPLTPFWNTQQTFWASSAVHDTTSMGYTYPEFNGLDMGQPDQVQQAIGAIVNNLYGGEGFVNSFAALQPAAMTTNLAAIAATTPKGSTSSSAVAGDAAAHTSAPSAALHASDNLAAPPPPAAQQVLVASVSPSSNEGEVQFYDWTARIHCKKYELGTSFGVLLFLGEPPENPDDWLISPNFVGAHHAFVNSAAGHCANCRNQPDLIIEGFVHLNNGIVKNSGLPSLEPNVVEPYLKKELHWRIQKADGTAAELTSLEVTVFATPMTLPPGGMFPVPGERRRHGDITHGRSGGSRQA